MKFLQNEKDVLNRYSPELACKLQEQGLINLEREDSPGIALFKEHGAVRLLIPTEFGGFGVSAVEALKYQVALGSLAPSLAIATTMHQYKVATLVEMAKNRDLSALLDKISSGNLLVASGGSEGNTDGNLFYPGVTASDTEDGLLVNGTKRPCCLTWSMDILSVLLLTEEDSKYGGELVNVIVDASDPTIKREKFWNNRILAASESDAVTLNNTRVSDDNVFAVGTPQNSKAFATSAFLWFETLATGSYLGMAGRLIEILMQENKIPRQDIAALDILFDSQLAALEYVALRMDNGDSLSEELLARLLRIRYATQDAITTISSQSVEYLGGLRFVTSEETTLLANSCRGLMFHPPARKVMNNNLQHYRETGSLSLA
jgi:alkylation response protein AidB-like acyl-CoA dehydrogenase